MRCSRHQLFVIQQKQSVCCPTFLFGVVCPATYKLHLGQLDLFAYKKKKGSMSNRYLVARSKKEGESSSEQLSFRSCVPPCGHYMVPGYTHDLCVVCFGAPGRPFLTLKELSPVFPAVLVPLPPRRSGVSTRGDRKWICWREW